MPMMADVEHGRGVCDSDVLSLKALFKAILSLPRVLRHNEQCNEWGLAGLLKQHGLACLCLHKKA